MTIEREVAEEFAIIRDRLEKVAILLIQNNEHSQIEAAFLVGCLQSICHENVVKFTELDKLERGFEDGE